ncbi:MAG: two-component regulator propeller domain-containing protein [Verrucomicrobiota bacterium]|jgi:ligand-binding sensor domain-containing protein/signal transduction histidine kinase
MNWLKPWLRRFGPGCAILLSAGSLFALDPARSVYQYNCQNWTRQNGLPADLITGITQTEDGYIWLGTQKGLVRFDGMEYKLIGVNLRQGQSQEIKNLKRARNGGLWLSFRRGSIGFYDGQRFSPIDDARWAGRSANATILETLDGAVWTGSDHGLGRWVKGKPLETFMDASFANSVLCFCEGPHGRVWMGTAEKGLFYWQDGKLEPFPDGSLKKDNIDSVAEGMDGRIWVGTGSFLRCYDSKFQSVQIPGLYGASSVILVDRHGVVWVANPGGGGLARYENGEFALLRKSDGLVSEAITSLYEDREGSLWVGTQNGLSEITDVKFPIYTAREGLPSSSVVSVSASRTGGLWITTEKGLACLDGEKVMDFTNNAAIRPGWFKRLYEVGNGDLYLVDNQKQLLQVSGGKVVMTYTNQLWPTGMLEDGEGFVVAAGDKLYRIQNGKMVPFAYAGGEEPTYYWIFNLCVARDGAIWVASNNGIFRLKNGVPRRWSTAEGLSDNYASCVFEDVDGAIWAGLDGGIARIKGDQLKSITSKQGLADGNIFEIVPDDHGYFWMDSIAGIVRASRKSLNDFADGKTDHIACDLFEGLEAMKFTGHTEREPVAGKTANGRIWFPNPEGLAMIDPEHFFTNNIVPPVLIQQIRINGIEVQGRRVTELPVGGGQMEFHFAALSYIAAQKAKLRYQLVGFDKDWVDAEGRRSVFYNNLKPGRYSFRVQGCNADGVWNTAGDSFAVELPPAFSQTIWFLAVCILSGLAGLGLIYRWLLYRAESKQRRLKEANDQLELKVSERTAELARANETMERTHQQLMVASRQAGMAEVATGVLHNVGNVLNSVNVSANLIEGQVQASGVGRLAKVVNLLDKHQSDLAGFLTQDEKGKQLHGYLAGLNNHLISERASLLEEVQSLSRNIEHIKEIVTMQQAYAHRVGVNETAQAAELLETALKMNEAAYIRHKIEIIREFEEVPPVLVDKHKVVQILLNLLQNAKRACSQSTQPEHKITVRLRRHGERALRMEVADNGVGIPPENLTRIFGHGFTTQTDGHGFGLHSGALDAKQLGGALSAHSEGPGKGATFILELPLQNTISTTSGRHVPASGGLDPAPLTVLPAGLPSKPQPPEKNAMAQVSR